MKYLRSILNFIGSHISWIIYHRMTIWDRMAYDQALIRGMHCTHVRVIGPQMTQEVRFHPGVKPSRNFMTYKEFMGAR